MAIKKFIKEVNNLAEAYDVLEYLSFTKQISGKKDIPMVQGGLKKGIEVKMLSAFRLKGDIDRRLRKIIRDIQDETFRVDCFLADLDEEWRGEVKTNNGRSW